MSRKSEIYFSLALRGTSHVTVEVGNGDDAEVNVSVIPEDIIQLAYDCLSDWDMLTEDQIQEIRNLRTEIEKCLDMHTAELRCGNCPSPRACVNCENFAKIHGQV